LSVSMSGEFYLNTRDTDVQAWVKLRGSTDESQLRNFVRLYPSSPLISDVQERLAALERLERERLEAARRAEAEREQVEKARLAKEQAERERLEKERLAREEGERHRLEAIRLTHERAEQDKAAEDLRPRAETGGDRPPSQSASLIPAEPTGTSPKQPDALSSSALVQAIKRELRRVGCYAGRIDDNWTDADIKLAVGKFAKYAHMPMEPSNAGKTDEPATHLLDAIRAKIDRVCPLECGVRQFEKDGKCVAKTCAAGMKLDSRGDCVATATLQAPSPSIAAPQTSAPHAATCTAQKDGCVAGTLSRGDPTGKWVGVCITAHTNCMKTGVWDTAFAGGRYGRVITGMIQK
jgi:hypothetical protein